MEEKQLFDKIGAVLNDRFDTKCFMTALIMEYAEFLETEHGISKDTTIRKLIDRADRISNANTTHN